jgi:hypothetical protein
VLRTANNDVPRFDYNPATLAAQGLLIEESRTNSIRNSTMQGAVAGTPGTLPTNWSTSGLGTVTQEVVGVGTQNGINYIDLRFSGTTSTAQLSLRLEQTIGIAAANGQTWSYSLWQSVVGGSTANMTITAPNALLFDSGSGFLAGSTFTGMSVNTTSSFTRQSGVFTIATANTAFIVPQISILFASGVAIDITLRIGLPQLEQGAFATSVIPTTTTALTRAADVASVNTLSPWFNAAEGTLYVESVLAGNAISKQGAQFDDGTESNSVQIRWASGSQAQAAVAVGGVTQASIAPSGYSTVGTIYKRAFAFAANDFEQAINGISVGTDTSGSIPAVTTLRFSSATGGNLLCGYIRRTTYYPRKLSSAELQAITA